jgi:cob(I)alamin adenosyltransferase
MERPMVQIFAGTGRGKSSAAIGQAIQAATNGDKVIILQFLKGIEDTEFIKKLEPEIRVMRFEKTEKDFQELSELEKIEEVKNVRNGFNYAKKVLSTAECDLLIMDEVLALVDMGIITDVDLCEALSTKSNRVHVVLTGINISNKIKNIADEITVLKSGTTLTE